MATEVSIARERIAGEEGALTVERTHTIKVPSFSSPDLSYKVNLEERSCDCPRYTNKLYKYEGAFCKHVVCGQALARVRARKFYTTPWRETVEEQVLQMCRWIFAPVLKNETEGDASDLLNEVEGFRYKTPAMVEAARQRCEKVEAMRDRKVA